MRTSSKLSLTAMVCLALATPAMAQLWNNGPLVTHPGGMTGAVAGADRSAISPGSTTFGFGAQNASGNRVADDFTNALPWNVDGICLFTYQTGATASSITGVSVKIWNGLPGAGTLVFDNAVNPATFSTSLTNIYRTTGASTTATDRRIQLVELGGMGLSLAPGTYWVDWALTGNVASGPWQPPVSDPNVLPSGGNALQFTTASAAWLPLVEGTAPNTVTPALPFLVKGTVIPEPSSLGLLLLGGLSMLRRRR